jgi:two-component system, chemotaxis family, protein-glutamate methylesterase/glutaminase
MRVIVVGTSAGGVRALKILLGELPAGLDAPILVVIHIAPSSPGYLPEMLSRAGRLPCAHPCQGERLQKGHVYIAPPDWHMLVGRRGIIHLTRGPKENQARPAVDPLFRSAALAYGHNVIGVILTGNLDDGTSGLLAIKQMGGTSVIQSPSDAEAPSMPQNAAEHVEIDHQVPLLEMARLLVRLTQERPMAERHAVPDAMRIESQIAADDAETLRGVAKVGSPTIFTCPDCHGALMRIRDDQLMRFRCHTGHAFTAHSLLAALNDTTENAVWSAVRALQEGAMLLEHLALHARDAGRTTEARAFEDEAESKMQQAEKMRRSVALAPVAESAGY